MPMAEKLDCSLGRRRIVGGLVLGADRCVKALCMTTHRAAALGFKRGVPGDGSLQGWTFLGRVKMDRA